MARIRTVKPEFFTSLDVARLSMEARLLFIGLWTHADDAGRNLNEPRLIKAALFPLDDHLTTERVVALMAELSEVGVIDLYTDAEGRRLYQVKGWKDHQRIDRPKESKYPSSIDRGCVVDSSSMDRGRVVLERKGEERTGGHGRLMADAILAYTMSVCLAERNTNAKFRDAVYSKATEERAPVLRAHLEQHPDATLDDLRELLRLPRLEPGAKKETFAHPTDCEVCGGEGLKEVSPNTYAPCDGIATNVVPIRGSA